jgi:hypothetical protein
MKRIVALIAMAVFVPMSSTPVSAAGFYRSGSEGVDISYPNCGDSIGKASFGIVGVTGGIVYSHNECLKSQASQFKDLSLYINTGLNDTDTSPHYAAALASCNGDRTCAAYTYGKGAAEDALAYAASEGVRSDRWWLDVELENTWSRDVMLNRQSLQGAFDALRDHGAQLVGAYSTTAQWNAITDGWQNQWPSWGATTWTSARQAAKFCKGHEFTGGPSLLMQFRSKRSAVDQDIAC